MENIRKIIEKYFLLFPEDKQNLSLLANQLRKSEDFINRKNFTGHIVANALVLNDNNEILTVFHNTLKMYIQPGGHINQEDNSIIDAASRELAEETGLKTACLDMWHADIKIPIFIESHLIPKNTEKMEDAHHHHDCIYIFRAKKAAINLQMEEVSDFQWINIREVMANNKESFIGKSLMRIFKLNILRKGKETQKEP